MQQFHTEPRSKGTPRHCADCEHFDGVAGVDAGYGDCHNPSLPRTHIQSTESCDGFRASTATKWPPAIPSKQRRLRG
jgi:hypothetical protein